MKIFISLLRCWLVFAIAIVSPTVFAQSTQTSYAGLTLGNVDGSGALINGIAVDSSGRYYMTDGATNRVIYRTYSDVSLLSESSYIPTISSQQFATGKEAISDGIGFLNPHGIAVDNIGNVYVADTGNHLIRKITKAGAVSTLAGSTGIAGSADGTGSIARFSSPRGLAVDAVGNIYVADTGNHTIRKILPSGVVTTIAGSAGLSGSVDAQDATARFNGPSGLAVDTTGKIYVVDLGNLVVRTVTPTGLVGTLAAVVPGLTSVAVDNNGTLFIGASSGIQQVTEKGIASPLFIGPAYIKPLLPAFSSVGNFRPVSPAPASNQAAMIACDANGSLIYSDRNKIYEAVPFTPISLVTAPTDLVGVDGASVRFSVTVKGSSPNYSWIGANYSGAYGLIRLGSILPSVDVICQRVIDRYGVLISTNAGTYAVCVYNIGSYVSPTATLTVTPRPPSLASLTATQYSAVAQTATLTAVASGAYTEYGSTLSYQWSLNGTEITGATKAAYTIESIRTTDAGDYSVVVTEQGTSGTATATTTTTLVVNATLVPPQITAAPAPVFVTAGKNATFTVASNGYPAPTYQWNFNGTPIPNATSASYTIPSAQVSDIGLYTVTMTNSSGTLTSDAAPLSVVLAVDGTWTVQASPTTFNLWSVCYADNRFVAVGESGTIVTSPDGINWTKQTSGTNAWLTSVGFGNGLFVAVGDAGTILTSTNGVTWILRNNSGARINAVTYGNGLYFAVGETGHLWTSVDGATWSTTNASNVGGTSTQLRGLVYVAPKFYISGAGGSLQWSYDGASVTKLVSGTGSFIESITYGRGQLVATGANGISTSSSDGNKWIAQTIDAGYRRGVAFWNNQFVAVDNGGSIATSFDGSGWISRATGTNQSMIAIAGSETAAVAVGFSGTILHTTATKSAPIVQTQPASLTEAIGGNIALSIKASGSAPLSYQWLKDGAPISGATSDRLFLPSVTAASSGGYTCIVTNSSGTATSAIAKVTLTAAFPSAGPVDQSFQVNPGLDKAPTAAAVQADGKILIGGDFVVFNQGLAQTGLARLNSDGSVDTTFKPGNVTSGAVNTIAIQSDGKILIGGTFASIGGVALPFLSRLKGDGSLDSTFRPDSVATRASLEQVIVTAPGQIMIANGGELLIRLNPDGSLDKNWAQLPILVPQLVSGMTTVKFVSCVQQPDGKILAVGLQPSGRSLGSAIRRFNPDGTIDASFQSPLVGGVVNSRTATMRALMDGRILFVSQGGTARKFLSSGAVDPSFNFTSLNQFSDAATALPDGKFWSAKSTTGVQRFNTDGSVDTAWQLGSPGFDRPITFMLGMDNGGLLVGGTFTQIGSAKRSFLARLNAQTNGGANTPEIQSVSQEYIQILAGETVTTRVLASGSPPLIYNGSFSAPSSSNVSTSLSSTDGVFSFSNIQSTGVITFTATSAGSPSATRSVYVRVLPSAPIITGRTVATQPSGSANIVLSAAASGSDPRTYQWFKDFNPLPGATQSTLTLSGRTADFGQYQLVIRNTLGTVASEPLTLSFVAPTITAQPTSASTSFGQTIILSVGATGYPAPVFQWRKNGVNIVGATSATYTVTNANDNDTGSYTVTVSNGMGSLISSPAVISVGPPNIISNVSVRTSLAAGQTLIVGAIVSGGAKDILVRAAGPALNQFGLVGAEDPKLEIYTTTNNPINNNDDWASTMSPLFASVGAFGFTPGSKDSALSQSINGAFTVQARSTVAGVILVEAYDLSIKPTPRLINISARNQVGRGSDILIAGFAISGSGAKRLLIRGIGPGLAQFGISGFLADPKIQIFDSSNVELASNDNWDPALAATSLSVGAFALSPNSKDAGVIVTLNAGATYTVWVSGADGGTGDGMVEIYELP